MNRRIRQTMSRGLLGLAALGALTIPTMVGAPFAGAQEIDPVGGGSPLGGCAGPQHQLVWDVYGELGADIDVASVSPERENLYAEAPAALGPGDYRVFAIAADDHVGPHFHHQPHEQFYVTIGGVRTPGMTPDLPDTDMWVANNSFPDDDHDLRTMPAGVAAELPGFDLGVLTLPTASSTVGFHHRSTLGEAEVLAADVNSILPAAVTFECVRPDLSLTKIVDGTDSDGEFGEVGQIVFGRSFTWRIAIVNKGEGRATNVVVDDVLPPGLTLVTGSSTTTSGAVIETAAGVAWSGDLQAGASVIVNFDTTVADHDAFASCLAGDVEPTDDQCTNSARIVRLDQHDDPTDNEDDASVTPEDPTYFNEEAGGPSADPDTEPAPKPTPAPDPAPAPAPVDATPEPPAPTPPATTPAPVEAPAPAPTPVATPAASVPVAPAPAPAPAPPVVRVPVFAPAPATAPPALARTGASVDRGLAGIVLVLVGGMFVQSGRSIETRRS